MLEFNELLRLRSAARSLPCDVSGCELYETDDYRWLCSSDEAVQTAMYLPEPSALVLPNHRAMMLATLMAPAPRAVLDLGCGGAGFVRHLRAARPAPLITAVERSGDMLDLARNYFELMPEQLVHVGDAVDFLGRDRGHYDLVLCDLFVDRESPAALTDALFFASIARRLRPGAAVAVNTLPDSGERLMQTVEAARQSFPGVALLQLPDLGNVILFLQRESLPVQELLEAGFAESVYADQPDMAEALSNLRRLG